MGNCDDKVSVRGSPVVGAPRLRRSQQWEQCGQRGEGNLPYMRGEAARLRRGQQREQCGGGNIPQMGGEVSELGVAKVSELRVVVSRVLTQVTGLGMGQPN